MEQCPLQPCIAAGPRDLDRGLEIKCHVRIRGSEIASEAMLLRESSTTPASSRDATVTDRKNFGCSGNGRGLKYGAIREDLRAAVCTVSGLRSRLPFRDKGAYIVP